MPSFSFDKQIRRPDALFGRAKTNADYYDTSRAQTMMRLDVSIPDLKKDRIHRNQAFYRSVDPNTSVNVDRAVHAKTNLLKPKSINFTDFGQQKSRDNCLLASMGDRYRNVMLDNTKEEREAAQ